MFKAHIVVVDGLRLDLRYWATMVDVRSVGVIASGEVAVDRGCRASGLVWRTIRALMRSSTVRVAVASVQVAMAMSVRTTGVLRMSHLRTGLQAGAHGLEKRAIESE
jgi:hypothetical protein